MGQHLIKEDMELHITYAGTAGVVSESAGPSAAEAGAEVGSASANAWLWGRRLAILGRL